MRFLPGTSVIHTDTFAKACEGEVTTSPSKSDDWIVVTGMSPQTSPIIEELRKQGQKVAGYWIGTDSFAATQDKMFRRMIAECDLHLCVHERIQKELESWGIKSEVLYPCARNVSDELPSAPEPLVGVYMPEPNLYMRAECDQVAKENPQLKFAYYGSLNGAYENLPANVQDCGRMTPEETGALSDKFSVVLRLCVHDGFPVGGIEVKMRSRNIIENFPYGGFCFAQTLEDVNTFLRDEKVHHKDIGPWPSWYREQCSPKKFKQKLETILTTHTT